MKPCGRPTALKPNKPSKFIFLSTYHAQNPRLNPIKKIIGSLKLNDSGEKVAIAEVKSYVKGFKRGGVYSIYNHRETNKLDEDFPAILFANCNLQAGSWNNKDRPISKQDYEIAAQNSILILRIEDLVRMWDVFRKGIIDKQKILNILTNFKGWLSVDSNFQIKELK